MTTGLFNYRSPAFRELLLNPTETEKKYNMEKDVVQEVLAKYQPKVIQLIQQRRKKEQDAAASTENAVRSPNGFKLFMSMFAQVPNAIDDLKNAIISREKRNAVITVTKKKDVNNARLLTNPSLNTNGFILAKHPSSVINWEDQEERNAKYLNEIEEVVKKATGAAYTFCGSSLFRQSGQTNPLAKVFNVAVGPIQSVHNDFTEDYGRRFIETYETQEIKTVGFGFIEKMREVGITVEELKNDYKMVICNTWRSVTDYPMDAMPLALVDKSTVRRDELVPSDLGGNGNGLPVFSSEYNPNHKFYYYPKLMKDEVMVFKTYDSDENPFIPTLHTAFNDENTKPDALPRKSVEARVMCLIPRRKHQHAKL